ncbi:signal peptidase I [Sessilibacter corallicola]|uniref:signal peptidase I n=1 Tax=Sessilibacter corallicola TaxID=2904075 RepID=UPI001E28986C|nr:signal peptidase I [Sessilibacter corallicola]MCE2026959.1 signal peptidase I [Sessilibacter corallicola]
MDSINFPLILMILVVGSGLIWLFDIAFLSAKRKTAIATVNSQFDTSDEQALEKNAAYQSAMGVASREPLLVEYSKSFFPVLAVVFVLRSFLYEPFQIPSESMVPTLEVGDFILVNKYTYGIRLPVFRNKIIDINEPERGDVMVFFPPGKKEYFIKRVIGLPGDKIVLRNNVLYINGEKQPQQFVESVSNQFGDYAVMTESLSGYEHPMRKLVRANRPIRSTDGSWVVDEGHYFMMGDNRDNSSDSRAWGQVPEENIVGKAVAIWMHWDSLFSVPSFSRTGAIE